MDSFEWKVTSRAEVWVPQPECPDLLPIMNGRRTGCRCLRMASDTPLDRGGWYITSLIRYSSGCPFRLNGNLAKNSEQRMQKGPTGRIATDPIFHARATEIAQGFIRDRPAEVNKLLEAERYGSVIGDNLYNAIFSYIRTTGYSANFEEATYIVKKIRRLVREDAGLPVDSKSNY